MTYPWQHLVRWVMSIGWCYLSYTGLRLNMLYPRVIARLKLLVTQCLRGRFTNLWLIISLIFLLEPYHARLITILLTCIMICWPRPLCLPLLRLCLFFVSILYLLHVHYQPGYVHVTAFPLIFQHQIIRKAERKLPYSGPYIRH